MRTAMQLCLVQILHRAFTCPIEILCGRAQITASAPVTSEGLGTAHVSLIWEKTFDI